MIWLQSLSTLSFDAKNHPIFCLHHPLHQWNGFKHVNSISSDANMDKWNFIIVFINKINLEIWYWLYFKDCHGRCSIRCLSFCPLIFPTRCLYHWSLKIFFLSRKFYVQGFFPSQSSTSWFWFIYSFMSLIYMMALRMFMTRPLKIFWDVLWGCLERYFPWVSILVIVNRDVYEVGWTWGWLFRPHPCSPIHSPSLRNFPWGWSGDFPRKICGD